MAVAGRDADDPVARRDEHEMRSDERRSQPVRHEDVMALRIAAEVLEPKLSHAVTKKGGGELVIHQLEVGRLDAQAAFQAGEVPDRLAGRAPARDLAPRDAQLGEVVGGRTE
jgi:hypothetical protein